MIRHLRVFAERFGSLLNRSRLERELDEELRFHLEMLAEENYRRGMSVEEARCAARRSLGGIEQMKETYRDQRGLPMIEKVFQDVRYGFRMLRRSPGFTAVAVITLALGIGANTAIFSVLNAVMVASLPVKNPSQLVLLKWSAGGWPSLVESLEGNSMKNPDGAGFTSESLSAQTYEALRTRNTVFAETFASAANINTFNVQYGGKAYTANADAVSGTYFNGLGVQPIAGRPIVSEDDSFSAGPVAVVSYAFWQSKLGGDTSAVGQTLVVNSSPVTIVGIAPPEFFGTQPGSNIDVWVPLKLYMPLTQQSFISGPSQSGGGTKSAAESSWDSSAVWWLNVMGRLKPGVDEQQARAELKVLFDQSVAEAARNAKKDENRPVLLTSQGGKGLDSLRRQFSTPLLVLMCAVGLVLLIACANVASLLVARATARQKEVALRLSLGAPRLRLIQQLLTESILLAGLGGVLSLLLARWLSELLVALPTRAGEQPIPVHVDILVLAFTAGVSLVTGLVFGLAPALSVTRLNLTSALKEGGAAGRVGAGRSLLTKALVSIQVALSLLLLIGAGLFLRTLKQLESVPLGFERERMVLFSVSPGLNGYYGPRLAEYYHQMQSRMTAIPGVRSVSFSAHGPIGGGESVSTVEIPGVLPPGQRIDMHRNVVGPGYFSTLGLALLEGRILDERDDSGAPKVAVVNQALVREAFGESDPLGKTLRLGREENQQDFQIVGVVADAAYNNVRKAPPPTGYFPHLQAPGVSGFMTFEVRTTGDPDSSVAALREVAARVDENVPLKRIETLTEAIDRTLMFEHMFSRLTGFFGLLALVLVCVGLYGTMSYFVARQTSEIGIRMALGAQPGRVFRMVLTEGLKITAAGVAAGLAGAFASTRLISSVLYNVAPIDALTFSSVSVLLICVALVACYIPALRATRVDPMVALRSE